ncbi:MAG: right-handed parallel beta-helix repeat-containing protein, partial [Promethearchaeota archaeon]
MKTSKKIGQLILILFILVFNYQIMNSLFLVNNPYDHSYNKSNNKIEKININGYWNLTGFPIYINDLDPNYNWSKTAKDNEWCKGSGTWKDPYIIENITINGMGSSSSIRILNSNKYFIINNVTLFNSSPRGIYLSNTTNGKIINNKIYNNSEAIWLQNQSNNNTVSGNLIYNNGHAIKIDDSANNLIIGNIVKNNSQNGILLENCNGTKISGNTLNSNELRGIELDNSNSNWILGNTVNNNSQNGIWLKNHCQNNTISNNTVKNSKHDGIEIKESSVNIIKGNIICNNRNGIEIKAGNNNRIKENFANNNSDYNILIYKSNYTMIDNNSIYGSKGGIYLITSNNNTVANNSIDLCDYGIHLIGSSSNIIKNNSMNNCILKLEGLNLKEFSSNNIENTNLINSHPIYFYKNDLKLSSRNFTSAAQVILVNCSISNVSDLVFSHSLVGIQLFYCKNITVSNNSIDDYGLELQNSANIYVKDNKMYKSGIIVSGTLSELASLDIDTSNLINNKSIYYYAEQKDLQESDFKKDGNAGQIILVNCSKSIISNLNMSWAIFSIYLFKCQNITIDNITTSHNGRSGIYLYNCNATNIYNSTIQKNNINGIDIFNCSKITLRNNIIEDIGYGIYSQFSNYSIISNNTIKSSQIGIFLFMSNFNNISYTKIIECSSYGIVFYGSNNNTILDNKLVLNEICFYEYFSYGNIFKNNFCDTDGDGLSDEEEITYSTDPSNPDTDEDGLNDGAEVNIYFTNPTDPDTDDDGFTDGEEVEAGTDPLDPNDYPFKEKEEEE